MILFSTLSQGWQAWLFCYLGLLSGLLFFATMFFANLLTKKGKLKTISPNSPTKTHNLTQTYDKTCSLSPKDKNNLIIDKKEENKTKNSNKSVKNINKSDKSSKKDKKRVQNENRKKKRQILKKKLCTFFTILWKFVINFATEITAIFILGAVVAATLIINLHFNYGSLPPVCIALWILSFLIAKFFLKTLAKIFLSIYNKHVKQKKVNNNATL